MTLREVRQIEEDVAYLASSWPLLVMLAAPGSQDLHAPHRGGPRPDAVLEQRRREDAEDRAEARKPGYVRPGVHAVPLAVNLLDLLADFVQAVSLVEQTVSQTAGVERLVSPASIYIDPRPYLHQAKAWLGVAQEADETTVPWVATQLAGMADKIAGYLGEVHDGQVLAAICPWCLGRTDKQPQGGELTLTVYARVSRAEQRGAIDEHELGGRVMRREPLIVCRGVNCTPPDSDVGVWVGPEEGPRRPGWPQREWDWLAKRLLLPERNRA